MSKNILLFSISFIIGLMVSAFLAGCTTVAIDSPKCRIKPVRMGKNPPDVYEMEVCEAEIKR